MKSSYVIIGGIILAVLVGIGGFFGGMAYAQGQSQAAASNFAQQRAAQGALPNAQGQGAQVTANNPCGFGGFQGMPNGAAPNGAQGNAPAGAPQGNPGTGGQAAGGNLAQLGNCVARGQIKSVNGDTIEISTADSVVTIKVNDNTVITKTDQGTVGDLQAGDRVTVFSKETGDTPTASGIQLQPAAAQPGQP